MNKNEIDALLLVNKPIDWTSNDVVQFIKSKFNFKKVGHAGTLDPKAEGLMILGINNATKKMSELLHLDKIYDLKIKFHYSSESYDMDQNYINLFLNEKKIYKKEIFSTINTFLNCVEYWQQPPKYSALKINGIRAYTLARQNVTFKLNSRLVSLYNIWNIDFNEKKQELSLSIHCSSGFYVRSFVNDFAKKMKINGLLVYLKRIKIKDYNLQNSLNILDIKKLSINDIDLDNYLIKNIF